MDHNSKCKLASSTGRGPINIALIKYWGKEDEDNIIPLNNSISLTLDMNTFYTETSVSVEVLPTDNEGLDSDTVELTVNGKVENISTRVLKLIQLFKELNKNDLISRHLLKITIHSHNTFPTAAGCASSASSMACLVTTLNEVFQCGLTKNQLSAYARLGSGSACRSIHSGFVEWVKSNQQDESLAVEIADQDHWKELKVMLIILSQSQKEISSTVGMKLSKETSELLPFRVKYLIPKRIDEMKSAIMTKDFQTLGELTMKESNNFHSICRDTYPPINYLTEMSDFVIKCVHKLNYTLGGIICSYTFDAGSNAFILYEEANQEIVLRFFQCVLIDSVPNPEWQVQLIEVSMQLIEERKMRIKEEIKDIVTFSIGNGAKIIK